MENLSGRVLKSYELNELIDMGGFGAVYRAHQAVVEREVAVKIIYPAFANRPSFIRRFEAEAQLVASLEHPHIVPLYDYWRDPKGAYIVMRWLRGGALRRKMERQAAQGITSTPAEIFELLVQIGSALAFAHRYGVVHRDLKPENILIDEEGNAYLADFGIAQILGSSEDDESRSMGSPAYASPEQFTNQATTAATDIYSLGVILYELLAGEHPFPEISDMTLTELTSARQTLVLPSILKVRPDLPSTIDRVLQKAAALDPSERFPDVTSLINAFRSVLQVDQNGQAALITSDILSAGGELPNPYKGLRAFQEADAVNFYGRQVLVTQLLRRLGEPGAFGRFLAVVGPSGSGKSSVVKAGLIPALRRNGLPNADRWYYVEMTPGTDPFQELETALMSIAIKPPENLKRELQRTIHGLQDAVSRLLANDPPEVEIFLFIDQFEEVFTMVESEQVTNRFLEVLYEAITNTQSRLRVVITLRADFYDRPLLRPYVSDLVSRRTEVVIPMTSAELEQAITKPAQRVGITLEPGLGREIINEVKEQIGALPLVQYLMSELFANRDGNRMTLEAYRKIGGVRGALTSRADEIFGNLNSFQQEAARQVFLRLTTLGEGTEDTRRRALLSELVSLNADSQSVRSVIDSFGKSRLLTFDRDPITRSPTVEITHEAIIREWKRLRQWLDASRTDVRMQRNLALLAAEWQNADRDGSYLLSGIRLDQYEIWSAETSVALTDLEHQLLAASIEQRERQDAEELRRQEREKRLEARARNRLRVLVAVLTIAVIGASGLSAFALNQSRIAQRESELSRSLAQEASARRALSEGDSDLAMALALEANQIENPSAQAARTLAEVAFAPGTRHILTGHTSGVLCVDIMTDNRLIASGSFDGTIRLWDAQTGQQIGEALTGHRADVQQVRFSPDGRYLASSAIEPIVIIWDVASRQPLFRLSDDLIDSTQKKVPGPIRALAFSPDSKYLFTAGDDLQIIVWDVASGSKVERITNVTSEHTVPIIALAITADGKTLISGARNGELFAWDISADAPQDWRYVRQYADESTRRQSVGDLSLIGDTASQTQQFLSISGANRLIVWDVASGKISYDLQLIGTEITSVAYNSIDQKVVFSTSTGNIEVWNRELNQRLYRLSGHRQEIKQIAVSADGNALVSASVDQTLRLWNIGDPSQIRQTLIPVLSADSTVNNYVAGGLFTADNRAFYVASSEGVIHKWDVQTGELLTAYTPVSFSRRIRTFTIHPSRDLLLIGYTNGEIYTWQPTEAEPTLWFTEHTNGVQALAFSSDGRQVVSADRQGKVFVWDFETAQIQRQLIGHNGYVYEAVFSPDDQHILTSSVDRSLIWWNAQTAAIESTLTGHTKAVPTVDISPNDRLAVSGSLNGEIIVWDLATRAERFRLVGHTGDLRTVKFSPNGNQIVSGGADGLVILWDVATGVELQRFEVITNSVRDVAFNPAGDTLIISEDRGGVELRRIFDLPQLLTWVQGNRYVRDFTCQERITYQIEPYCQQDG